MITRRIEKAFAAVVLGGALTACSSPERTIRPPAGTICDSCGVCEESLPPTSANHVIGPIDYPDPPPAGGDHAPCWATWGVHEDVVPPENWVHNLEHGGVVFLYRSRDALAAATRDAGPDASVQAELDALVAGLPRALSTEYPALPKTFAVVSWGYRLVSDCVDLNAALRFYTAHFNQAPEDIPSNPSCN